MSKEYKPILFSPGKLTLQDLKSFFGRLEASKTIKPDWGLNSAFNPEEVDNAFKEFFAQTPVRYIEKKEEVKPASAIKLNRRQRRAQNRKK